MSICHDSDHENDIINRATLRLNNTRVTFHEIAMTAHTGSVLSRVSCRIPSESQSDGSRW